MSEIRQREKGGHADDLSVTVVNAIADREGVDPLELDPCLYEVIDPAALNALFSGPEDTENGPISRIVFSYNGYDVHIAGDGEVRISEGE